MHCQPTGKCVLEKPFRLWYVTTSPHTQVYIVNIDHVYFHHSFQNVNVAKRVVNCRFNMIMLRTSVWNCVLVPLLDRY